MKQITETVEEFALSTNQMKNLVLSELTGWINGRFVNEILLAIAKKIKDQPAIEALSKELSMSAPIVSQLKKDYFNLGGKDQPFETPDEIKIRLLEKEILSRKEGEYILQLRSRAAEQADNKELSARATEDLAKILGYVEGLRKELRQVRSRVEKASNSPQRSQN